MSDTSEMIRRPAKMEPAHPGRLLARILEGDEDNAPVSIMAAADALDVSRQTLHRVLAGVGGVTADMAVRLGTFLGNGPGIWLRMQAAYDLWHAEHDTTKRNVVPIAQARKAIARRVAAAVQSRAAAKRAPRRGKVRARA